jgi:hypothetical protein
MLVGLPDSSPNAANDSLKGMARLTQASL